MSYIFTDPESSVSDDRVNFLPDDYLSEEEPEDLEKDESLFEDEEAPEEDFYANLAKSIDPSKLATLAANLIEAINDDKSSRTEWEKKTELGFKYLGIKTEDVGKLPFPEACAAFDSTLLIALLRGYSTARAELFPAAGPARVEIIGKSLKATEDKGERVKTYINYYLTQEDADYYPDSDQLLLYTYLVGTAFRKVYQDPVTGFPVARFVKPQDLIVNLHATSLLSSSRITHIIYLTKKEIILNELSGEFLKDTLPLINENEDENLSSTKKVIQNLEGINPNATENKSLFMYYEVHCDLDDTELHGQDLEENHNKLPKPYIIKLCCATRKIVSIKRNWEEGDEKFKRKECFNRYIYLPSFGVYGLGLIHLLGSNSITLTSILRQLIDAGTFKNFPGGVKSKAFKAEDNNLTPRPGQFLDIETGDLPIAEGFMPMPYAEPCQTLLQLRNELIQQTANIASTAEAELPEVGTNAPVGTTLAMLEVATKVQSSVLRSLRVSLGNELKLLAKLFGECLPDTPYPFAVPGGEQVIMRADFDNFVNIVPVSDPNVLTTTHRLITAESLLRLSQQAPEIHNQKEVYRRMYAAMNLEDIDKILVEDPKPISLDPLSENAYLALGSQLMVTPAQNDDAHLLIHAQLEQDPLIQQNPQAIFHIRIHSQLHKASKALKQLVQNKQQELMNKQKQLIEAQERGEFVLLGAIAEQLKLHKMQEEQIMQLQSLPADKALELPEIQNMIAANDAQETQQRIEQQQQESMEEKQRQLMAEQNKVDKQVAMADIEQRREASFLKDEEAKLRAEAEAFKTQTKFESDMAKLETQKEMAREKQAADLELEKLKHPSEQVME